MTNSSTQQSPIPSLHPDGSLHLEFGKNSQNLLIALKPVIDSFEVSSAAAIFNLGLSSAKIEDNSWNFWREFAAIFIERLRLTPDLESLRDKIEVNYESKDLKQVVDRAVFIQGQEYLSESVLAEHWKKLSEFYKTQIKNYKGTVSEFLYSLNPDLHTAGKVFFHLVENKNDSDTPFAFLATYQSTHNKKSQNLPLKYALEEFKEDEKRLMNLLGTVNRLAKESLFIKALLDSGELFYPLKFTANEACSFLQEVPLYEKQGVICRIPNWWTRHNKTATVNLVVGDKKESLVGLDSLVKFEVQLALNGVELSVSEAQKLLDQVEGLAFLKGQWVQVNHIQLNQALQNWEKLKKLTKNEQFNFKEAMQFVLQPDKLLKKTEDIDAGALEVSLGKWLNSVLEKLEGANFNDTKKVNLPKSFKGILRPYQESGLNWLKLLDTINLSGCLADDMGLGKTIQVLAFLTTVAKDSRAKNSPPSLLVVPTSLISNWIAEIEKFAPRLKFKVAHSSAGIKALGIKTKKSDLNNLQLVITTYGLTKRYQWLQELDWEYIILDEAQAIKNSGTKQSKVIKTLKSRNRLALTGTPIENNIGDLWSLFDFLNPGLLGSAKEFKSVCEKQNAHARIKKVISPYILRRLKTDKSVISDLPKKIELDSFVNLTKRQVVLYQQLVNELKKKLEESDKGIKRKGLVLASLTKFKQICNHPDQYLGDENYNGIDSGKFQKLKEICEIIREKREKVLIFSQYKEIIPHLQNYLSEIFGQKGLTLTGSTSVAKRKKFVENFQNANSYTPFFILSLKAGGTGLNLTAANHVIHFDRWWNPAVENQATDRAFRIGQKNNVLVHKFITKGTLEEKIDKMLKEKQSLSDNLIGGKAEKFITELKNDELIDLFSLSL